MSVADVGIQALLCLILVDLTWNFHTLTEVLWFNKKKHSTELNQHTLFVDVLGLGMADRMPRVNIGREAQLKLRRHALGAGHAT